MGSDEPVVLKRATHYVCAQCGRPGIPDPGFTLIDPRYAIGRCSGDHKGEQHLVQDGVQYQSKKRTKKVKQK